MPMDRRTVLAAAGTGLALISGAGFWRVTRVPQTATLPWRLDPTPPADVRLDAFRHAILAPNPHNRQPWLIQLAGKDEALIRCDLDKRLPETDPFDRQITIGFGTFIELARMAAAERGVRMDIMPFPEGEAFPRLDDRAVARLKFTPDPMVIKDMLFAQIPTRRSNKEPYDLSRTVSADLAAQVADREAAFSVDAKLVGSVRAAVLDALLIEQMAPLKYGESVNLIRIGHTEVDSNPDGIDLVGPQIEALKAIGMLDRAQLTDPKSQSFQIGLEQLQAAYGSIPALVWITSPGNSRADQLETGRRYVRANLRATSLGLGMHPMSQSLQEYPAVKTAFDRIHGLLGATGTQRVQMLARVGYGPLTTPSPRWPLEKHIR
jgi:hypothetical protein